MTIQGLRLFGMSFLAFALCLNASALVAQDAATEEKAVKLPSAESIIAENIKASGGKAKLEAISSQIMKGKFKMPAMGIEGDFTDYKIKGKSFQSMNIPQMGEMKKGHSGEVFWDSSAMMGTRLIQGPELAQTKRASDIFPMLHVKDHYKSMVCVAVAKVGKEDCYQLKMQPNTGDEENWYISKSSYLLVQTSGKAKSPMGDIETKTLLSEYKDVNGVKYPHMIHIDQGQNKIQVICTSLEFDAEIPAKTFDLPAEVQQLVDMAKKAKEKKKQSPTQPAGK